MFTKEQKRILFELARSSIIEYIENQRKFPVRISDPGLQEVCGAFVSIKKNSRLRGCIGRVITETALAQVVSEMAVEAAVNDPRFPPLSLRELRGVELEISVLSSPILVKDVQDIEVGRDGLIINKDSYSGLLLPQVATECGWGREEFLANTCLKAGLPPNAWDNEAAIYRFSAEVFRESEV